MHATAASEGHEAPEPPPLPAGVPGLQGWLAQVEGRLDGAIKSESVASMATGLMQKIMATRTLAAAQAVAAQPPSPSDAAAAIDDRQLDAPAVVDEPLINDMSGTPAPPTRGGAADGGEVGVQAQPRNADGPAPPVELDGARRRRRRDAAISADGETDDGQAKRQRVAPQHSIDVEAPMSEQGLGSQRQRDKANRGCTCARGGWIQPPADEGRY